jgi:hypothetical protein
MRDQVAHVTKRDASGKRREGARTGAVWVLYLPAHLVL